MKPLQLAESVLPLGEFKTQASRVLRQLHESNRPVVITQNGRPSAVLITPEEFDRVQEHDRFLAGIREGLEDIEAGRFVEDADLDAALEALDRE
jgi:prevent-host-death family protein